MTGSTKMTIQPIEKYTLEEFRRLSRLPAADARSEYARLVRKGARLSPSMIEENYSWREDVAMRKW